MHIAVIAFSLKIFDIVAGSRQGHDDIYPASVFLNSSLSLGAAAWNFFRVFLL